MAMVKVTSGLEANIPKNLNTKSGSNLLDASFSSYLNGAEETFVLNLESSRNLSKKADDGEIDIFSAEKYFNEGVDEENQENGEPQNKHKIDEPAANIVSLQQKTRPLTPSIHSESSWNSRSALLQKVSRNNHHQPPPAKPNNKSYGKKFLARIGCNCYCKDKNSIEVDDQDGENSFNRGKYHGKSKQNPIKTRILAQSCESITTGANHKDLHFKKIDELGLGLKTDERFAVPVFDPKGGNPGVKIQLQQEEEPRKSLEVFGFPITEKERSKLSLEKNIGVLTWDAIVPKAEEIDIINVGASSNGTYEDDYAESDASSDLFEIESFPSNNTGNPSLARQGSDGISCYAPSEVSIDWSVVTASAADFSIMSDSEDLKIPAVRTNPNRVVHNGRDKMKRRSGILLGCNSHKAVGVVGDAYKASEKTSMELPQRNLKTHEPIMPMTTFHAESKVSRFDAGNRKHEFTTRSFSSTYTGRPADFLCI